VSGLDVVPFDKKARTNRFVNMTQNRCDGPSIANETVADQDDTVVVTYHASVKIALKEHHESRKENEVAKP